MEESKTDDRFIIEVSTNNGGHNTAESESVDTEEKGLPLLMFSKRVQVSVPRSVLVGIPYFRKRLASASPQSSSLTLKLPTIKFLDAFVEAIAHYSDSTDRATGTGTRSLDVKSSNQFQLYSVASLLQIGHLLKECEAYIASHLTTGSFLFAVQHAIKLKRPRLLHACFVWLKRFGGVAGMGSRTAIEVDVAQRRLVHGKNSLLVSAFEELAPKDRQHAEPFYAPAAITMDSQPSKPSSDSSSSSTPSSSPTHPHPAETGAPAGTELVDVSYDSDDLLGSSIGAGAGAGAGSGAGAGAGVGSDDTPLDAVHSDPELVASLDLEAHIEVGEGSDDDDDDDDGDDGGDRPPHPTTKPPELPKPKPDRDSKDTPLPVAPAASGADGGSGGADLGRRRPRFRSRNNSESLPMSPSRITAIPTVWKEEVGVIEPEPYAYAYHAKTRGYAGMTKCYLVRHRDGLSSRDLPPGWDEWTWELRDILGLQKDGNTPGSSLFLNPFGHLRKAHGVAAALFGTQALHWYELRRERDDKLVMVAVSTGTEGQYIMSRSCARLGMHSEHYLGFMECNFIGTTFNTYDCGVGDETPATGAELGAALPSIARRKLMTITYDTNVLGRVPNSLQVCLDSHTPAKHFKSRQAVWNEDLMAWTMEFKGRARLPSKKNFQLVAPEDTHAKTPPVYFLLGKLSKDVFAVDYRAPMSAVHAMTCALTTFTSKTVCA